MPSLEPCGEIAASAALAVVSAEMDSVDRLGATLGSWHETLYALVKDASELDATLQMASRTFTSLTRQLADERCRANAAESAARDAVESKDTISKALAAVSRADRLSRAEKSCQTAHDEPAFGFSQEAPSFPDDEMNAVLKSALEMTLDLITQATAAHSDSWARLVAAASAKMDRLDDRLGMCVAAAAENLAARSSLSSEKKALETALAIRDRDMQVLLLENHAQKPKMDMLEARVEGLERERDALKEAYRTTCERLADAETKRDQFREDAATNALRVKIAHENLRKSGELHAQVQEAHQRQTLQIQKQQLEQRRFAQLPPRVPKPVVNASLKAGVDAVAVEAEPDKGSADQCVISAESQVPLSPRKRKNRDDEQGPRTAPSWQPPATPIKAAALPTPRAPPLPPPKAPLPPPKAPLSPPKAPLPPPKAPLPPQKAPLPPPKAPLPPPKAPLPEEIATSSGPDVKTQAAEPQICIGFSGFKNKALDLAYTADARDRMARVCERLGAVVLQTATEQFDPRITHLIVAPRVRTIKTYAASVGGRWIIEQLSWIGDSERAGRFLPEADYGNRMPRVLEGHRVYLDPDFEAENTAAVVEHAEFIVKMGGGTLVGNSGEASMVLTRSDRRREFENGHDWRSFIKAIPQYH